MEIHQVRYFLALCETANFTQAAKKCNVSQPSLTTAIKKLENELGGILFQRERRNASLTRLGRSVRPHLEQLYAAGEAAKSEAVHFASEEESVLTLGVMTTIGPLRLVDFFGKATELLSDTDIQIQESPGNDLIKALVDGDIDVGLVGMPVLPTQLHAMPLYEERYAVAFPPTHRFREAETVSVKELNGEDYLVRLHCEFVDYFELSAQATPFQTTVRYTSERDDWIQAMILAQMGCTIVPEYMHLLPGIERRLLVAPEIARNVSLVTVAGRQLTPPMAKLVRMAQSYPWMKQEE